MLPRGYLYYTFRTPLNWLFCFLIGYVLGRMQISLAASFYKLATFMAMLLALEIIILLVIRKHHKGHIRKKNTWTHK